MGVLLLIIGLLLFVGLVVVHEFGHFLAARRNGIEVEEFGIGFPPRAWSKRLKTGVLLSLNWLPLGGFVRLKGEHDADEEPGSFGAATLLAKVKVMLAGVVMNLVAAFALLTILAAIGMPRVLENQFTVAQDTKIVRHEVLIGYVEPASPADQANLQSRDQLLSIRDEKGEALTVTKAAQLPEVTEKLAGQTVQINIKRDGELLQLQTKLRTTEEVEASKTTNDSKGYLGLAPTEYVVQRSTWSSPLVAAGLIKQFTIATFKGLGSAIAGVIKGDTAKATEQVAGPVGIYVVLRDGSLLGLNFTLLIIAIISLTLAIMNVLPIPALDGGRLFVLLISRAVGKPLSRHAEEWIHGTGFALLMLLFVLITVVDIKRFF